MKLLMSVFEFVCDWLVEFWIPSLLVTGLIASVVLSVQIIIEDNRAWEQFALENNCKVVSHTEGETFTTFGVSKSGNTVVSTGFTEAKEGWLCDDGVTYYRTAR